MREPDVTLTDFGLAAACAAFAFVIIQTAGNRSSLRLAAAGFFLFLGLSAAIGGTVHGFCASEESGTCVTLWLLTLETVGLASASLWVAGAMLLSERAARPLALLAIPLLTIYSGSVLLVTRQFWIAFSAYLPAMLLLSFGFLAVRAQLRPGTWLVGVSGVVTSLASCAVQYLQMGLHPIYLSHNALAHVIQGIAMTLLFVSLRQAVSAPHPV